MRISEHDGIVLAGATRVRDSWRQCRICGRPRWPAPGPLGGLERRGGVLGLRTAPVLLSDMDRADDPFEVRLGEVPSTLTMVGASRLDEDAGVPMFGSGWP